MKTQLPVRQKGQITIMVAMLMFGMLGIVGLAVDSGMAYVTKAKLNAAVDSAAVAAAKAVTTGKDQAEQTDNARQAAQKFFDANFPSGYLGATASLDTSKSDFVQFDTPTSGAITINPSASAIMPLRLLKVLDLNNVTVGARSQSIRKDLDLIFVIDSSGSMSPVWSTVKANANSFLDQFSPTEDRVGLVHFSAGAVSDIKISTSTRGFDRTTMKSTISGLGNGGTTNYAEALWQARDQLNSITTNPSSLRVVVFFSDGEPNTLAARYQVNATSTSTTTTTTVTCNKNGKGCKSSNSTAPPVNSTTAVCAGGITGAKSGGSTSGFYIVDQRDTRMPAPCTNLGGSATQTTGDTVNNNVAGTYVSTTTKSTTPLPKQMPGYYDVHDPNDKSFPIAGTSVPLTVGNSFSSTNVFNAATNVAVEMATALRNQNVYIFALGLDGNGGFDADLLKNMANTTDAKLYNNKQPAGVYCYAANINGLKPCFSKLASEILRISK